MALLNSFWTKITDVFAYITSILIAVARLFLITIIMFLSGLQQILFARLEVMNAEIRAIPIRCDREKALDNIAYIDKLCCANPELAEISEECYDENNFIDPEDFNEGEGEN